MPRKVTLYLETSIPSALFQKPAERKESTEIFFQKILPLYEVFVSEFVIDEIEATPNQTRRSLLLKSIESFSVLSITPEAEKLAVEYLRYLKIPEPDALHIAIASVEGIEYLVTWNMNHIAKEQTRRIVDNVNFLHHLPRFFIATPEDFFD